MPHAPDPQWKWRRQLAKRSPHAVIQSMSGRSKKKPRIDGSQAVLIGSAIRFGQWLPEAVEFVKANQQALSKVPVALFTVHIMNLGDNEQSRSNRLAYLNAVRPLLNPVDEVFFPGKGDPAWMSLVERLISRMVGAPVGDFRDWEKIHGWAQTVLAGTSNFA